MGSGNSSGLQVVTGSLRTVANTWDGESVSIGSIPGQTKDLTLNRLNAGIFQLIVSPYEAVLNAVSDRSSEGREQMADIASELRASADTYDQAENKNVKAAQQIGH